MPFTLIDMNTYPRREHYAHYTGSACTYALTVNLDITRLHRHNLYPAMLWLLTDTVNRFEAFRTALSPDGPGVFDRMHPSYTVMGKGRETFSVIWTAFNADYPAFLAAYRADAAQYADASAMFPKPGMPENVFDVSMLPWVSFTAFNLNLYDARKYLLPIFTMGRAFEAGGRTLLPLAVQVHHAVCDGYHVGRFVETLQASIDAFPWTDASISSEAEKNAACLRLSK